MFMICFGEEFQEHLVMVLIDFCGSELSELTHVIKDSQF